MLLVSSCLNSSVQQEQGNHIETQQQLRQRQKDPAPAVPCTVTVFGASALVDMDLRKNPAQAVLCVQFNS